MRVVGLHSPEFETEKNPDKVREQARKLGVTYPVVIDNDLRMWDALGNLYWPTTYLIDRKRIIRHVHIGETHEGSRQALELERVLAGLLKESP